jgi:hypothetical protein
LFAALAAPGCGTDGDVGQVTGKVRFHGRPVPSGTVTFIGADGNAVYSKIASDGTYRIARVPVGEAKIAVDSHPRVPAGLQRPRHTAPGEPAHGTAPAPAEQSVAIPERFKKAESSGLTYHVTKGEQTYDIELKP